MESSPGFMELLADNLTGIGFLLVLLSLGMGYLFDGDPGCMGVAGVMLVAGAAMLLLGVGVFSG